MPRTLSTLIFALALPAVFGGCRGHGHATVYDPHYCELARDMCYGEVCFLPPVDAVAPVVDALAGPHSVDEYIAVALAQNPNVQAARKKVDAAAYRVPQAASLEDPELQVMSWPIYPNVPQYTSGRMTADVNVSQKLPWCGKLRTKAEAAEAELNMARADLHAVELEVIEQVRRTYYELYYLQNAQRVSEESQRLASDFVETADTKYRAATANQQDVLRAQMEVLNVDNELITTRQELASMQARLSRLLHILPDTAVRALDQLPAEEAPRDLERLYAQAVAARPELHAQLAAIQRDRRMVENARLQYFPDITLVAGWGGMTTEGATDPLADGIDNINAGLMTNIPLYHQRLSAAVREAEAKAVASSRQYDALRDETLEQVKDLFVQAQSRAELVRLFRDSIIPKAQQTLEVSTQAYRNGQVDLLQLIDNYREVLRYRTAYYRQESQLRQSLATLDRVVGGVAPRTEQIKSPLPPEQLPPGNLVPGSEQP